MSIFDPVDHVPDAPTWRCPHCRTLQPETSRCRACARATVTCATCHFHRPSFVGDMGYCALDPARAPLAADEVRSCWVLSTTDLGREGGLFDALLPPPPMTAEAHPGSLPAAGGSERAQRPPSANLDRRDQAPHQLDPGDADHDPVERTGRLIEAPRVAPARVLESELRRRSQHVLD